MFLDYLTAAAIADELRDTLLGARVQSVVQPDRLSITFELYAGRRQYLTLSADAGREGIRLSGDRSRRGAGAPTPLALALRSRLTGARLADIEQPPFERVLELVFQGEAELRLVAELMGRMANLVLIDERRRIVAVARQVTPKMTTARVVLPGRTYAPPPEPDKVAPPELVVEDLAQWLTDAGRAPAWRVLVRSIRGVSPLLAREAVHRAAGDARSLADAVDPSALGASLGSLMELPGRGGWMPSVVRDGDTVSAYAPYQLTHLPGAEAVPTIGEAIEAFEAARDGGDRYGTARAEVARLLDEARQRVQRRHEALARERIDDAEIERLRLAGDLILAYQSAVEPGQGTLEALMTEGEPPLVIRLDPTRTPLENAQDYYKRHSRAKRAAAEVPKRIEESESLLATLDQLAVDLSMADDRPAIDAVYESLREAGYLGRPMPRRATGRTGPLRVVSSDGLAVLVGRNSRQNETVTFEKGKRGDRWLHARDVPGAHVVIKSAGRAVPERTLREAAALAAWFSAARDKSAVAVAVTDVRHVRRRRGGGPGMVTFRHEETLTVRPEPVLITDSP